MVVTKAKDQIRNTGFRRKVWERGKEEGGERGGLHPI
jgi:hypothetical protein